MLQLASERLFLDNPTMAGGSTATRQPSWGGMRGSKEPWSPTKLPYIMSNPTKGGISYR